jgi:hypothetical protein
VNKMASPKPKAEKIIGLIPVRPRAAVSRPPRPPRCPWPQSEAVGLRAAVEGDLRQHREGDLELIGKHADQPHHHAVASFAQLMSLPGDNTPRGLHLPRGGHGVTHMTFGQRPDTGFD